MAIYHLERKLENPDYQIPPDLDKTVDEWKIYQGAMGGEISDKDRKAFLMRAIAHFRGLRGSIKSLYGIPETPATGTPGQPRPGIGAILAGIGAAVYGKMDASQIADYFRTSDLGAAKNVTPKKTKKESMFNTEYTNVPGTL